MRTSPPADLMVNRSPFEPGTRSMSPNEQKITFGVRAIACALSIISSGVTHTGQPGPCTSSTPSGRSWSSPFLTMEWVWPPQTSISTHGRVWMRRISATILPATSPSRYSSRYFIAVAPFGRPSQGRAIVWLDLIDNGGLKLAELVQFSQRLIRSLGLGLVDPADGKSDMHQNVFSGLRLRHIFQASFAHDAAELYLGHAQPVLIVGVDHLAWYCKTHRSSSLSIPLQKLVGDDRLPECNPAVVRRNQGVQKYVKAATPQLYYRTLQEAMILEGAATEANTGEPIAFPDADAHLDDGCGQRVVKFGGDLFCQPALGNVARDRRYGGAEIEDHGRSCVDVEGIEFRVETAAILRCANRGGFEGNPRSAATASNNLPHEDVSTVWILLASIVSTRSSCFSVTPGKRVMAAGMFCPKASRR